MKVAAILLVLGIMATGCGEGAQTGNTVPPRLTLHTVTLPALPKWVLRKFGGQCPCTRDGVGVEPNGDVLVGVGAADGCCIYPYRLVRFDPRRRRWAPGGIVNPPECNGGCISAETAFLPVGQTVWMIDNYSGSVYRGRFSKGWSTARKVVRAGPGRPWGIVNLLTPGRQGRVWVVGSTDPSCSTSADVSSVGRAVVAPATSVCGRSVIGLAGGRSRHVRAIHASRSGTATDATVGPGGSVWLLVPRFRRCPGPSCRRSALIRYDPTRRRLTWHMIPARLWPDIGMLSEGNSGYVYADPTGTVWVVAIVSQGFRVIRLHHGSFSSRIVRLPGLTGLFRPPMDRNGDIWVCNSIAHTVTVFDPGTGQRTKLRNRHGTSLLEDMHGGMWYVRGNRTGWSSCYW